MKKALALILCCVLLLSGCQLASLEEGASQDQLIGVIAAFATLETGEPDENGAVQIISSNNYDEIENLVITADMAYLGINNETLENGEEAIGSVSQGGLTDTHMNVHIADRAETTELEAMLWADRSCSPVILELYAVYMRADGSLYVSKSSPSANFENSSGSLSVSETNTRTVAGKSKAQTYSFRISLNFCEPTASLCIREMDANNRELRALTLSRADFNEEGYRYAVSAAAAYVMVESYTEDGSVAWTLYNRPEGGGEQTHNCHFATDTNLGGIETLPLALDFAE